MCRFGRNQSIPNSWTSLHSGSRWCLSRYRFSPRLNTRMTKTSRRTKQLSFSNLFLLRPAGAEVGRPSVPQAFRRNIARIPDKLCPCPLFQLVLNLSAQFPSVSASRDQALLRATEMAGESKSPRSHQVKKLPRLIAKSREHFQG